MNHDPESSVNLNIQFQTMVQDVSRNKDGSWNVAVIQDGKQWMTVSDIVIFATNAYTSYLLPEYSERIVPAKNQVIMSESWPYFIWDKVWSGFGTDYEYWSQRDAG